jgi:hypothetical protein
LSRRTRIAIVVAAIAVFCAAGAVVVAIQLAPTLTGLAGCEDATAPAVSEVRDDAKRVGELFPRLGEFTATHWQFREARPRTCPEFGPMDYVYSGFVTLAPATLEAYRRDHKWAAADAPDVPPDLREYAPGAPNWQRSTTFDQAVAGAAPVFRLDAASGTLYFNMIR